MSKPKIIYVLSNAFSGSTILSLYLNNHPSILNLGEISNLSKLYRQKSVCTCGLKFPRCSFWGPVLHDLSFYNQNTKNNKSYRFDIVDKNIDIKGFTIKKFLFLLGIRMRCLFLKNTRENYINKNIFFFKTISNSVNSSKYIIDNSKQPERLSLLLESSKLDIHCIFIKRDLLEILHSNLKRNKKTRKWIPFKVLREIFILYFRNRSLEKVFGKIEPSKKISIYFDQFSKNPELFSKKVFDFLSLDISAVNYGNKVDINDLHLFGWNKILRNKKEVFVENNIHNRSLKSIPLIYRYLFKLVFRKGYFVKPLL